MSSSSSSSLLYMIALLLVLIHSSIQSGFPNDVFTSLSKQISEVQDHINFYAKPLVTSYRYLEIITDVSCLKRSRSETFPKYFFIGMDLLKEEIKENYQIKFYFEVIYFTLHFHHKDFPREVIEKFEQCTASLKQYFIKLQSKGRHMTCDLPNSISAKDRNSLYTLIQSQRKAIFFINVLAMKFTLFSNVAKLNKTRYLDNK
ncbi:hypothetical protein KSF78_0004640 [Schistosoma japonicum]|nr:hypothetical protein KSF78_0004640 [Schistosoma japonicum]